MSTKNISHGLLLYLNSCLHCTGFQESPIIWAVGGSPDFEVITSRHHSCMVLKAQGIVVKHGMGAKEKHVCGNPVAEEHTLTGTLHRGISGDNVM